MNEKAQITFNSCEEVKNIEVSTSVSPEGQLLNVYTYLYDVCPCRQIIIGVRIYICRNFYAMQTKKIFTGYSRCQVIDKCYAGKFSFLFLNPCHFIDDIKVDIIAHYIC